MTHRLTKTLFSFLFFLISLSIPLQVPAQDAEEALGDISLGDLLNLELTTAGKKAEKISDIPASVVVVTREDIKKYGYQTLTEILEHIPGLYNIDDYGWSGANFGVRGFWTGFPKNVIFMINGVEQRFEANGDYKVRMMGVPVEAIERIEVIRGPMSVIYGTGAFFGAINIITGDLPDKEQLNMVSVSYGSENTQKAFARLSGNIEGYHDRFRYSQRST
ncbi:MAG: Plug domain-containing protein [Desulfobacterales bacterium]|nr:Plug domain-containing protein [Desulfobacterales bacterium]